LAQLPDDLQDIHQHILLIVVFEHNNVVFPTKLLAAGSLATSHPSAGLSRNTLAIDSMTFDRFFGKPSCGWHKICSIHGGASTEDHFST